MKIGIDIVQNNRLNLEKADLFLSSNELKLFKKLNSNLSKMNFLAGRFSGKESIIKASNKKLLFRKIEILKDTNGAPIVYYEGALKKNINLSISHERDYTVSFCLIE